MEVDASRQAGGKMSDLAVVLLSHFLAAAGAALLTLGACRLIGMWLA